MMPVYNAGAYVEEAIRSVLAQDPGPEAMQIAVVDDASTDIDLEQLVRRVGGSRVEYHRQPHNVGSVSNFNTCLENARGHLVHLLHADDRVLPGFYAAIEELSAAHPEAGGFFSRHRWIDEAGRPIGTEREEAPVTGVIPGWLERIATRQTIQFVAIVIRREVYEEVGGFFGVECGEDWEMWTRIASRRPMAYSPSVLGEYRVHKQSITSRKMLSGQNIRDWAWVMKTIQTYLPREMRRRVWKTSVRTCAHDGLLYANQLWDQDRNEVSAKLWMREAARLHLDAALLWKIAKLYTRISFDKR
jgi:glycosyltransferase involved in cell wall biosynthesis